MFTRYLRDGRIPYGVIVVLPNGNYGVSLCNPKDDFLKERGRNVAQARAEKGQILANFDGRIYITPNAAAQAAQPGADRNRGCLPQRKAKEIVDTVIWTTQKAREYYAKAPVVVEEGTVA